MQVEIAYGTLHIDCMTIKHFSIIYPHRYQLSIAETTPTNLWCLKPTFLGGFYHVYWGLSYICWSFHGL